MVPSSKMEKSIGMQESSVERNLFRAFLLLEAESSGKINIYYL